ncbi:MAG: DUF1592 domain-containing protein [Myxococcota bacterium]
MTTCTATRGAAHWLLGLGLLGLGACTGLFDTAGSSGDPGGPGPNRPGTDDPRVGPEGNALELWAEQCASCHGDFGPGSALSSGDENGDFRLDVSAAIERHGDGLEAYIETAMPQAEPERCVGACAETLGNYLRGIQPPPTEVVCVEGAGPPVGSREVMLLTSHEYQNTLERLLGVPSDFGSRVENNNGQRGGFVDMTGKTMSSTLLDTYSRNAETIAEWAVANGRPFDCSDRAACANRFVDEFLFEAFRGRVSDAQKSAYRQLFDEYQDEGLELALRATLTSPYFLYRMEMGIDLTAAQGMGYGDLVDGAPSDVRILDPFELASTLAFRLTGSAPDRSLLEAARDGNLTTRAEVRAQVERLIDSPEGRERMGHFVTTWFRIDDLEDLSRPDTPELTDEVKAAMVEEVRTHFLYVFYDDSVPWSEFFSGDYTFLNRTLAEFYGVEGQFDDSFQRTAVTGRGGPIASGAFMTVNAHAERTAPILRAVRARETALCHYIDPPNSPIAGDDIDAQRAAAQERVTAAEEQAGALSSRDFYFLYTDGISACAGCHERIINPMFGMEDFDNLGRHRPSAGGNAVLETINGVETTVSIEGTLFGVASTSDPETIEYAGAKDFSNQIANTEAVTACLARRSFRFLTGATYVDRDLDPSYQESLTPEQRSAYNCAASRMLESFDTNNQSPRAMFIELATDSLLLFRR